MQQKQVYMASSPCLHYTEHQRKDMFDLFDSMKTTKHSTLAKKNFAPNLESTHFSHQGAAARENIHCRMWAAV